MRTQLNPLKPHALDKFPILILIGRPASGKSEIIKFSRGSERGGYAHANARLEVDFNRLWNLGVERI